MPAVELIKVVAAVASIWGAIVLPLIVAVWRLASKVERHAQAIDEVVKPRLKAIEHDIRAHDTRIRTLETRVP